MMLEAIVQELDAVALCTPNGWEDKEIGSVIASDMISDILVGDGEDQLLVTSLTSIQMVRTAALIGAVGILLVHRRQVPAALQEAAQEHEIPLFRSPLAKYDVCVRIGRLEEMGR